MARERRKPAGFSLLPIPAWMCTYADTVTLLMTFFVLIMTFGSVDTKKFQELVGAFQQMLGFCPDGNIGTSFVPPSPMRLGQESSQGSETPPEYGDMEPLEGHLRICLESVDLDELVDLQQIERGLLLRLRPQMLFEPGQVEMKTQDAAVLSVVAGALRPLPHRLRIFAHGDEFFVPTRQVPDNRALAVARASAVCEYLRAQGRLDARRLQAAAVAAEADAGGGAIEILIMRPKRNALHL